MSVARRFDEGYFPTPKVDSAMVLGYLMLINLTPLSEMENLLTLTAVCLNDCETGNRKEPSVTTFLESGL